MPELRVVEEGRYLLRGYVKVSEKDVDERLSEVTLVKVINDDISIMMNLYYKRKQYNAVIVDARRKVVSKKAALIVNGVKVKILRPSVARMDMLYNLITGKYQY